MLIIFRDSGHLTRVQKKHNFILSKTRVKIENTFGQIKGRWRICQYNNVYSGKRAVDIIKACCVLHNFCLLSKEQYDSKEYCVIAEEPEYNIFIRNDFQGVEKRDNICTVLENY